MLHRVDDNPAAGVFPAICTGCTPQDPRVLGLRPSTTAVFSEELGRAVTVPGQDSGQNAAASVISAAGGVPFVLLHYRPPDLQAGFVPWQNVTGGQNFEAPNHRSPDLQTDLLPQMSGIGRSGTGGSNFLNQTEWILDPRVTFGNTLYPAMQLQGWGNQFTGGANIVVHPPWMPTGGLPADYGLENRNCAQVRQPMGFGGPVQLAGDGHNTGSQDEFFHRGHDFQPTRVSVEDSFGSRKVWWLQRFSAGEMVQPTEDGESGWSSLHRALHFGHLAVASVLIESGASLTLEVIKLRTPVDLDSGPVAQVIGEQQSLVATEVFSWGNGANYQLGTGNQHVQKLPGRVDSLHGCFIKLVSAAKFFSVAISSHGEVYTWGFGRGGRLGHPEFDIHSGRLAAVITPRQVISGLRSRHVKAVAAAKHHTVIATEGGNVYTWGSNREGQLGYTSEDTKATPRKVTSLKAKIVAFSAANKHTTVDSECGEVFTWGCNKEGQLGYGTSKSASNYSPRLVDYLQGKMFTTGSGRIGSGRRRARSGRREAENPGHEPAHVAPLPQFSLLARHLAMRAEKFARIPNSILVDNPISPDRITCPHTIFSWITEGGIEITPYDQGERGICWAASLQRGHQYFMALNGSLVEPLTVEGIISGVPRRYLRGEGIINLICAKQYMEQQGRLTEFIVYERTLSNYENFETVIETLLLDGPVCVSFHVYTEGNYDRYSSREANANLVFVPTEIQSESSYFERFEQHCVIITGYGAQNIRGNMTEFWEFQNSYGESWGRGGFGKMARRKGLIRQACQFKL